MSPRVLLVYANPAITASPVAPYGMERVAWSLRLAGCEPVMLAPFVEERPLELLDEALAAGPWDLVAVSVRNIDDALVVRGSTPTADADPRWPDLDTSFYLDAVRPLVQRAVQALGEDRVLLGGPAISSGPEVVTRFLGAMRAVAGPAEDLVWRLGRSLANGEGPVLPDDPRVVDLRTGRGPGPAHDPRPRPRRFADAWRPAPGPTPRMGEYLALARARGGRVPVQVAAGCDRRCHFCVEARFTGYAVRPRPVPEIVAEIDSLVAVGVRRFWLATSELNVPDERHAIELLTALAGRDLDLAAFLQVAPVSDALLDAMEAAGMDPSELSFELGHLDPELLRAGAGPANRKQIDALVQTWLRRGYPTLGGSVLLGAHPAETEASIASAVAAALDYDAALPQGLGLSYACGARVYPRTGLADWIAGHPDRAAPDLYGAQDPSFVLPVVYSRPGSPRQLLAQVQAALAGARGQVGPMNAEAPVGAARLAAEALVNRGIWRVQQDRLAEALACFVEAEAAAPEHLEALAQQGLLLANRLGRPEPAAAAFRRLLVALEPGDPRRDEVRRALEALGA